MRKSLVLSAALCLAACATQPAGEPIGARNVILFVGDGMGVSTVTAARIHAGQQAGGSGEEHNLSFDEFPHVALVKTYNLDRQVSDSAGTMTAMVTGYTSRFGVLSVHPGVERGDCAGTLERPLTTLLEYAEAAGFATGVVTTTAITHATPAANYAHASERGWENDALVPPEAAAQGCRDIARQLLGFGLGDGIEVALGGGRSHFAPATQADPEYPDRFGQRLDGQDLVAGWLQADRRRSYVWNSEQFAALDPAGPGQVLGMFEPGQMQYEADRRTTGENEPSLADMTAFAIRKLRRNGKGFFLAVEGGRIDHAHHAGNAYRALTDTVAMDEAVRAALALTDPENTLILVTADHSHTLTMSGYPRRGNPILGKVEWTEGDYLLDLKGLPYTTLGYQNGPGYREALPDLSAVDTTAPEFLQVAAYLTDGETHAGEDVPAYAHGLGAERLHGVIEQREIFDVLYRALFGKAPPTRE